MSEQVSESRDEQSRPSSRKAGEKKNSVEIRARKSERNDASLENIQRRDKEREENQREPEIEISSSVNRKEVFFRLQPSRGKMHEDFSRCKTRNRKRERYEEEGRKERGGSEL